MIPLSAPHLNGNEWTYVKECLDTGWVSSSGAFVGRFEEAVARYTGARYAVACASGTAALHISLLLAGVKPEDEVLVPTLTFVATINAIRYVNAHPVFMDCDNYYNLDPEKLSDFLNRETDSRSGGTWNKRTGRRIAAILPVHVFGNAVQLEGLMETRASHGIAVVEDAAESLGTSYRSGSYSGKHTGTIGDLGCLSFNGNKIITTGGGGMILTDNPAHAARAAYLTTQAKDDEVRFVHNEVGFNYRLTNVQAALGLAQLEQLPGFLEIKRSHYADYDRQLQGTQGLELGPLPPYATNNCWLVAVQVDPARYGSDREALMNRMSIRGIQTRPVWRLNHLQRPFAECQHYRIERAIDLWQKTLNLPSSVGLTADELKIVTEELRRAS